MKIFSLETKKHLLGWSLICGVALNLLLNRITFVIVSPPTCQTIDSISCNSGSYGFPLNVHFGNFQEDVLAVTLKQEVFPILNYFIWILVVFIILSLIRHFRKMIAS
jgi:hypothetical protein